ncbi:MAG: hypothetical protein NT091_03710, partial [Candidatus Falkowbacteria bacterium]|nr:hypothetical protein [Candidatus Falkowbacteria bacterium]
LNEENDLPSASQGRVPIATIQAAFDRYKNGGDEKALMEIPRPLRPKLVELLKLEQEGRLETYDSRRQRLSTEAGAKEQVLQESDQTDLKEIRNRINLSLVDFMPNLGDMVLVLRSNGSVCEGKVIDIDGDDIKVSLEGGLTKTIRVDNIRQANERWRETLKRVE